MLTSVAKRINFGGKDRTARLKDFRNETVAVKDCQIDARRLLSFHSVSADGRCLQAFDQLVTACATGESDPGWPLAKRDQTQCDMRGLPARFSRKVRHSIHFPNAEDFLHECACRLPDWH